MSSPTITEQSRTEVHLQGATFDSIDVIDLSSLHSPSIDDRRALARKIDQACTQAGFFYIKVTLFLGNPINTLIEKQSDAVVRRTMEYPKSLSLKPTRRLINSSLSQSKKRWTTT